MSSAKTKRVLRLIMAPVLLLATISCSRLPKDLTLEEKDFFEKANIIMSRSERKTFMSLPQEKRSEFIEDFWKRRDPDPSTDMNEFKIEFFNRIEEANKLFREGSRNGWQTDRGRMWVQLGAPDRRDPYPSGYSFYEPPVEVWHYGFFIIIFVDSNREGIYRIEPTSAAQINQILQAQMQLNKGEPLAGAFKQPYGALFDFTMQAETEGDVTTFRFLVPVKLIAFFQNLETQKGEAVLHVKAIIKKDIKKNKKDTVVASQEKDYPLSLTEAQVSKLPETLVLQMEFTLEQGEYRADVTIENKVDQAKAQKQAKFRIK